MNTTADITHELLSAWLDGALDDKQASEVEARLSQDPALQRQVALMMLNERRLRSEVHRMVAERPIPSALSALLEEPGVTEAREAKQREPLSQRLRDWLSPAGFGPGLVAASVVTALVIGIFAGNQLDSSLPQPAQALALADMTIESGDRNFALLDAQPAGEPIALGDDIQGQVAYSFKNSDGRWCRQFEQHDFNSGQSIAGVACRGADAWRVELLQTLDQTRNDSEHFRAASGDELEVLDNFVMQRGTGEVIVGEPEAELIRRGWR